MSDERGPVENYEYPGETAEAQRSRGCHHDSMRVDGTLDCNCLRCGADGYWHDGHRHDEHHPSGKILIRLGCLDATRAAVSAASLMTPQEDA